MSIKIKQLIVKIQLLSWNVPGFIGNMTNDIVNTTTVIHKAVIGNTIEIFGITTADIRITVNINNCNWKHPNKYKTLPSQLQLEVQEQAQLLTQSHLWLEILNNYRFIKHLSLKCGLGISSSKDLSMMSTCVCPQE